MKMNKFLPLSVVGALLFSCSSGSSDVVKLNNRTVVTGRVINRSAEDPNVIQWNLCDPFNDERVTSDLADDGSFFMESDGLSMSHNMTLKYGDFISFFGSPGDSIHLVIDAEKSRGDLDAVCFIGDKAAENNEFYLYDDYLSSVINADYKNKLDLNVEPSKVIKQINERLNSYKDSLDAYQVRKGVEMSDGLKDFIYRDMIFAMANRLHDYKPNDAESKLELYSDPLFGINDNDNFSSMLFPYHLSSYLGATFVADPEFIAAANNNDLALLVRRGVNLIMNEPAALSRDVMLWEFLMKVSEQYPVLEDSTLKYTFSNVEIKEKLTSAINKHKEMMAADKYIIKGGVHYLESNGAEVELPSTDIFEYLSSKYSGKVLYIDVYATWCAPCISEMKVAPKLHNLMHGEEVVFVNLCMASSVDDWRSFVAKFDLKENYWFSESATMKFMGSYNISGFPSYLLVGKDGEIVTMKADRPSQIESVSKQIKSVL